MSGMASVDKMRVSLLIPIKTIRKVDRLAENSGMSRNEIAGVLLDRGTSSVVLTDDDMEYIKQMVRRNRENRG